MRTIEHLPELCEARLGLLSLEPLLAAGLCGPASAGTKGVLEQ
jgi:hypothetical protein